MTTSINALLMIPPRGSSPGEEWVASGVRAAAADLFTRLRSLDQKPSLYVLAAEEDDREAYSTLGADGAYLSPKNFHFGVALTRFVRENRSDVVLYFGAGSAPLLEKEVLEHAVHRAGEAASAWALVNNLHSTDWAVFNHPDGIINFQDRFPSDNQFGWVLSNEIRYEVEAAAPAAGSMVDIDTPSDLLMMEGHPGIGPNLNAFYRQHSHPLSEEVAEIRSILGTEAKTISLIGRSSSFVWRNLERETKLWVRAFIEERGMVASGRRKDGLVHSLVGEMLELMGPDRFIQLLTDLSDGVLWDTRVWMAHRGEWPSRADRFAADLGWYEQISDRKLRELTRAIGNASIPIIAGGHGVVSGNVIALLETLFQ